MLDPAPLPDQVVSVPYDASDFKVKLVPPTATTNGSEAGYWGLQHELAPKSPELAKGVVPWEVIVTNKWCVAAIVKDPVVGYDNSASPKLIDKTFSFGNEFAT